MENHIKVVAYLQIILGALGVLSAVLIFAVFGGIAGLLGAVSDQSPEAGAAIPIIGILAIVVVAVIAIISVPAILAGVGLLQYRDWARILTIVLSALNLLNVPVGTIIGAYALWVMLNEETTRLFARPAARF